MKKAVKITNWVFMIGLALIVANLVAAKVQKYLGRIDPLHPPEVMPLPEAINYEELHFWIYLITWLVIYGIVRLILHARLKSPEK